MTKQESAVAVRQAAEVEFTDADLALKLIVGGDLSNLTVEQKGQLYIDMCSAIGLNPAFRPFGIIKTKDGAEKFYAFKAATEQLRKLNGITMVSLERETLGDTVLYTCTLRDKNGREDIDVGSVSIKGLGGEFLANAYMRAATKAKRRCTLAISGIGILDETEIEAIPNTTIVDVTNLTSQQTQAAPPTNPEPKSADPRIKAMAQLHAVAAEAGLDHERMSKLAQHIFPVSSTTELTLDQVKTFATALNQDQGDVPGFIETIYAIHTMGNGEGNKRMKAGAFGSSMKKCIKLAMALKLKIEQGQEITNDEAAEPVQTTSIAPEGPPDPPEPITNERVTAIKEAAEAITEMVEVVVESRQTPSDIEPLPFPTHNPPVEIIDNTTGEIIDIQPSLGQQVDDIPLQSVPNGWTELWKFLKANGVKDRAELETMIGSFGGDSPEQVYRKVAAALLRS